MRFKINIEKTNQPNNFKLPINYQYELSAWIYKIIHFGNSDFANWLHSKGYMDDKKQFKLFTFSNLQIKDIGIEGDRLIIKSNDATLVVSFYMDEVVEPFIIGIFQNQKFTLGDKKSKVHFLVKSVERLPEPVIYSEMAFSTLSPIVISRKEDENGNNIKYLTPEDDEYASLFLKNLMAKFVAVIKNEKEKSKVLDLSTCKSKFELLCIPKSKLIKIKADTPEQTQVKGFMYDFRLTAPIELVKLGYNAGFGEKNSLGFGCVNIRGSENY